MISLSIDQNHNQKQIKYIHCIFLLTLRGSIQLEGPEFVTC